MSTSDKQKPETNASGKKSLHEVFKEQIERKKNQGETKHNNQTTQYNKKIGNQIAKKPNNQRRRTGI